MIFTHVLEHPKSLSSSLAQKVAQKHQIKALLEFCIGVLIHQKISFVLCTTEFSLLIEFKLRKIL